MNSRGNRGKVLFRSSFPLDSGGERETCANRQKYIFFNLEYRGRKSGRFKKKWKIKKEDGRLRKKMEDKGRRWKIKKEGNYIQVNETIFTSLWKITNEDEISRKNMEDLKKD